MKRVKLFISLKLHLLSMIFLMWNLNAAGQNKKEITVGYVDVYEKHPKISFTISSQAEYDQYPNTKPLAKPKLKSSKTHHIITTKAKQFNLIKYKDYGAEEGYNGYEFLGHFPDLKMYAITQNTTAEHLGFSTMVLIDSLTAYQYAIASIGDAAVELPILSKTCKYLLYFYNWPYDDNSTFIGVLKINDRKNPQNLLVEKASFNTKDWAVENMKWIDDETFLVKAFTVQKHNRQGYRTYQYFKASL